MEVKITYRVAGSHADFQKAKDIVMEYLDTLNVDLSYMNIPDEFLTMPQKYSGDEGVLILALDGDKTIGCVGVRKLGDGIAELKRLYVRDSHRGFKVGTNLVDKALQHARRLGYNKIRLDVIPALHKAKALYHSFGFYPIPQYFHNPVHGTVFMQKDL